jgi:hypothetical protein
MVTSIAKQPFGEVIASSLDSCILQAWEWDNYPAYGSLMHIEEDENTFIGIITTITTAPFDGSRMPTAYKKTGTELKAEYPYIFALLRTTLTATIVGHKTKKITLAMPPTKPVKIHAFSFSFSGTLSEHEIKLALQRIITIHEPHQADMLIQHYLLQQKSAGTLAGESLRSLIAAYIETVGNDYKRIFGLNRFIQGL